MPRLSRSLPAYRKHKASGQAIVVLSGRMHYLGPHGTKASRDAYDRRIAEWLANERQAAPAAPEQAAALTVVELLRAYWRHAKRYYRKDGEPTGELAPILSAIKITQRLYGRTPAAEFSPLKLQAVRQAMIAANWARSTINRQIGRVVRAFSWGVAHELIPGSVVHALREVPGLRKGRTEAKEAPPVLSVPDEVIDACRPHLPAVVADMVRIQRLTGARPSEVCTMRPSEIDTSGPVWTYTPGSHKTEHHGRRRVVAIGPKAQAILQPYLSRDAEAFCFSPADSERKRREAAHANRKTPARHGNAPGTNRKAKPKRTAGVRYTADSYRRAIERACNKAFPVPAEYRTPKAAELSEEEATRRRALAKRWRASHRWAPNQLRHSAATDIRAKFGLEAAQVALGHASAQVTQIYAERDLSRALEIAAAVG